MTPTYNPNSIPPHLRPLVRRLVHQEGETLSALHVGTDVLIAWGLGWQHDRLPIVVEETDRIRAQAVTQVAEAVRAVAQISHFRDEYGHWPDCPGCLLNMALDEVMTATVTPPVTEPPVHPWPNRRWAPDTTANTADPGE